MSKSRPLDVISFHDKLSAIKFLAVLVVYIFRQLTYWVAKFCSPSISFYSSLGRPGVLRCGGSLLLLHESPEFVGGKFCCLPTLCLFVDDHGPVLWFAYGFDRVRPVSQLALIVTQHILSLKCEHVSYKKRLVYHDMLSINGNLFPGIGKSFLIIGNLFPTIGN